jgi:hypothetical protein
MITNGAKYTRGINSRMAKAAFKTRRLFSPAIRTSI